MGSIFISPRNLDLEVIQIQSESFCILIQGSRSSDKCNCIFKKLSLRSIKIGSYWCFESLLTRIKLLFCGSLSYIQIELYSYQPLFSWIRIQIFYFFIISDPDPTDSDHVKSGSKKDLAHNNGTSSGSEYTVVPFCITCLHP